MNGTASQPVAPAADPHTTAVSGAPPELLTVGVEEEFLLVDPDTARPVPVAEAVIEHLAPQLRGQVQREFLATQVEIGSAPVHGLDALRRSLAVLRESLADAAERAGARLLAVGTGPVGATGPTPGAPLTDDARYRRMIEHFGELIPSPALNGMHVHVGVPDRETGVQVLNFLRPWLPLLAAATANSPFADGRDTGYASWRSLLWNIWPSVGPTPYLESAAHYDSLVAQLIDTGAMLDDGMIYWYARLSSHLPTVELRLGDVCPTVDDSILLAALVRGLVATVREDIDAGRRAPAVPHHLLTAAHWRASRDGLEGVTVDPVSGGVAPAWRVLGRLVDTITPSLAAHGDLETVIALLERLRRSGSGAARQRAIVAAGGSMTDVVDYLAARTRGSYPGRDAASA